MPRKSKNSLIPIVNNEETEVIKPKKGQKKDVTTVESTPESKVQTAIKKARQQKKVIINDSDNESDFEYTIEEINKEKPNLKEAPMITQPEVKIVEKIVEKPVEKIVEKVIEVEKIVPIDIFKTNEWISETKKYNDNIAKLQKENDLLKKLGTHVDHLSRLSNMSRQMKIKF